MPALLLLMLLFMFPSPAAAEDAAIAGLFAWKGVEGTLVLSSLKSGRTIVHNDERASRRFPGARENWRTGTAAKSHPCGRRTRRTSAGAAGPNQCQEKLATTTSKLPSGKGKASACASRNGTAASGALRRAMASISGEQSTPCHETPGCRATSTSVEKPVPQPRSRPCPRSAGTPSRSLASAAS